MADVVERHDTTGIGAGRATGGVIGIYAALGLVLGFLAFIAALGLRGTDLTDPTNAMAATSSLLIGVFPFVAAPIIAVIGAVWAGQATRDAGQGALAGSIGAVVGVLVMFILVAIGGALGLAATGVNVMDVNIGGGDVDVNAPSAGLVQYFASVGGIVYLFAHLLIGALVGALIGWLAPETRYPAYTRERTTRPAEI